MYQSLASYSYATVGQTISGEGSVFPRTADMVFADQTRLTVYFITDNNNDALSHNAARLAGGHSAFWQLITPGTAAPRSPVANLLTQGLIG